MVSYGAAKAATHHLTKSLSASDAMPKNTIVTGTKRMPVYLL